MGGFGVGINKGLVVGNKKEYIHTSPEFRWQARPSLFTSEQRRDSGNDTRRRRPQGPLQVQGAPTCWRAASSHRWETSATWASTPCREDSWL